MNNEIEVEILNLYVQLTLKFEKNTEFIDSMRLIYVQVTGGDNLLHEDKIRRRKNNSN